MTKSPIRVAHVSAYSDRGAGRTAKRIVDAIQAADEDATFTHEFFAFDSVGAPRRFFHRTLVQLTRSIIRITWPELSHPFSFPIFATGIGRRIRSGGFDLVHLHWIGDYSLSLFDLRNLQVPVLWTLHDQWPILAIEHVHGGTAFNQDWEAEYFGSERRSRRRREVLIRTKFELYPANLHFISPSHWIKERAKNSTYARKIRTSLIQNPIDTNWWKPVAGTLDSGTLDLPRTEVLLLFSAKEGLNDDNKGGSEALELSKFIAQNFPEKRVTLAVVGGRKCRYEIENLDVIGLGVVADDEILRFLYSLADVTLVPSKVDNFPSVILESMACGTPVGALDDFGPSEMICDGKNGFLSKSVQGLGHKIVSFLNSDQSVQRGVAQECVDSCQKRWGLQKIGGEYLRVYAEALRLRPPLEAQIPPLA